MKVFTQRLSRKLLDFPAGSTGRRKGKLALATVAVSILSLFGSVVGSAIISPKPASAWSWSPSVLLQGRAACGIFQTVSNLQFTASNGEAGHAQIIGGTAQKPQYKFQFNRVPTFGMTVTAYARCGGSATWSRTSFPVYRPISGTTATRNLCFNWVGSCII